MDNNGTVAATRKSRPITDAARARARRDRTARTCAAKKAYRARIKSVLNDTHDEPLAAAWRRVCPLPIGSEFGIPDRPGIIEDLADFAEALQLSLVGMRGDRLCQVVEKYAVWECRPLGQTHSQTDRQPGSLNYWAPSKSCWEPDATPQG